MTVEKTMTLSVIVPCFNERAAIADTIETLSQVLGTSGTDEIIVVDDGSTDGSFDIAKGLKRRHPKLNVLRHETNRGYGAALKTGIRRAQSELIAITDADGTYPNAQLPDLVTEITEADMVVGARTGENVYYSPIRRIPKFFLQYYCRWITNQPIPDINSGLRVFRKSVVNRFLHVLPDTFSFTTTITLAMMTNDYAVRFVPINYSQRKGKSKINPIRDTIRFCQLILRTGIYFAPLRTFSPIIACLALAFLGCAAHDVFVAKNLTDKTLVFLTLTVNSLLFVLLADIIDKRIGR